MKEHQILFNGPMVRAILKGQKTQTRRVIGDQWSDWASVHKDGSGTGWIAAAPKPVSAEETARRYPGAEGFRCPYGVPGDTLWVRETWSRCGRSVYPCPDAWYRADFSELEDPSTCPDHDRGCTGNRADCWACVRAREGAFRWRPAIHMPRWLSRITLEVTEVRAQRVQEITPADIIAEGVKVPTNDGRVLIALGTGVTEHLPARRADLTFEEIQTAYFAALWDSINAKRGHSWESNPWVWAISFRRRV